MLTSYALNDTSDESNESYRVQLDVFEGPMDLLLFLVRKNEVDIFDIPIASITRQYLQYLEDLSVIDLELSGDFLVMASTLIEIKSRMMLPVSSQAESEDEVDPRNELVQKLLEYKRFKDAASDLLKCAEQWSEYFPRVNNDRNSIAHDVDIRQQPIRELALWDLVSAYDHIMRQTQTETAETYLYDDTPLEIHIDRIQHQLTLKTETPFHELFQRSATRSEIAGTFLAILELVRHAEITLSQIGEFGEILIRKTTPSQERTQPNPLDSSQE